MNYSYSIRAGAAALASLISVGVAHAAPVADALVPAKASDVQLQGYVGERMDACLKNRVMAQDIEKLVQPFRDKKEVGNGDWRCEYWGKWFTSAALAYAWKPTTENRAVIDKAAHELIETAAPDGYIGTRQPQDHLKGWDVWGRKYVLLGLLNYYDLTGDKGALEAAKRHTDTLLAETGPGKANIAGIGYPDWKGLPPSSILEPIVLLYRRTGEQKYLDYANYIVGQWSQPSALAPEALKLVERSLANTPAAKMPSSKSYEMTSCYEGLCELYRVTGKPEYLQAAQNMARSIEDSELFIVGSGSSREVWFGGHTKQTNSNADPMETCVTATWMKYCYQLLRLTGDSRYADELETSLYNALLGALKEDGSWWSYYTPLNGVKKASHEQHRDVGLSCCVVSGPRALYLTPLWAAMTDKDGAVINLFGRGEATLNLPSGNRVKIAQATDYPATGLVKISVEPQKSDNFTLKLRVPRWSESTSLLVNGKKSPVAAVAGSYAAITRQWKKGDLVQIEFDMRGRLDKDPGGSGQVAISRGPLVLATDRRLTDATDIGGFSFAPDGTQHLELSPITLPRGVWLAFAAPVRGADGTTAKIALCDWASAGNTWDASSTYRTWLAQPFDTVATTGLEGSNWIWFAGEDIPLNGDVKQNWPVGPRYFRKTIDVPAEGLKQASLLLTADDEWTLWVNGEKMGSNDHWQQPRSHDLTARLKPGRNVIAIEVVNNNPSPAGLIARLNLLPKTGKAQRLVTDTNWKSAKTADGNWQTPDFDDTAWPAAKILGAYGCAPWFNIEVN